jgi:hypothetical protein
MTEKGFVNDGEGCNDGERGVMTEERVADGKEI